MIPPYFFVFDIESVGLHGQGYIYGYVVLDSATGAIVEEGSGRIPLKMALHEASESDVLWVHTHVEPVCESIVEEPHLLALYLTFWRAWTRWQSRGALMAADVPWPVESRFLIACMEARFGGQQIARANEGPYPIVDVASVRMAVGLNATETVRRLPNEMPAHNPLCDARQSARLLFEALALPGRIESAVWNLLGTRDPDELTAHLYEYRRFATEFRAEEHPANVRPFSEWQDDHGSCLWWRVPVQEPPYVGDPRWDTWPFAEEERASLWWTPIHAIANAVMAKAGA